MLKKPLILAIETSCDETAVAILEGEENLLANEVYSQIQKHQAFGGVFPEIASRLHVEKINLVIQAALDKAGKTITDIDYFAITAGPGLIGSLHVGLQAAKTLAWYYDKPLIGVHHIIGHIFANAYVATLQYPFLALIVSGGHTQLILSQSENEFEIIADTADDAVGEAYDKVARLLDLGYPGGPIIDKLAKQGKNIVKLPKIATQNALEFSFSGLKSAVMQALARAKKNNETITAADMCASFQEAALNQLIEKTALAMQKYQPQQLLVAGGVAANSRLRELVLATFSDNCEVVIPPLWCCTDNAAMIARAAAVNLKQGKLSDLSLGANPGLAI